MKTIFQPQEIAITAAPPKLRRAIGTPLPAGTWALPALPLLVLEARQYLSPWVFMWTMAFALFTVCKILTCLDALRCGTTSGIYIWGYLLAWPGMEAAAFLSRPANAKAPDAMDWLEALAKMAFGSILLWGIARLAMPTLPVFAGWVGMIGIVFVLHFGLFNIASLAWRKAGVNAPPLMRNPLAARSLADFWGARWNTAFNEVVFRFTYKPLRRPTNAAVATLLVFCLSGLVHELVISLPADGGYGLPTAYFILQGFGIVLEKSRVGLRIGLGRGIRGRLFAILMTAGPACWLFHPRFIHTVILPMLADIGAI